jgi:hypothetical protein
LYLVIFNCLTGDMTGIQRDFFQVSVPVEVWKHRVQESSLGHHMVLEWSVHFWERQNSVPDNMSRISVTKCTHLLLQVCVLRKGELKHFEKNSPTVAHACRKRRLKWVLGTWGYNWTTQSPGNINTDTWSSRLGVGAQG